MQNLNNSLKAGRGIRMIVNNCILLCDDRESGLPHRLVFNRLADEGVEL